MTLEELFVWVFVIPLSFSSPLLFHDGQLIERETRGRLSAAVSGTVLELSEMLTILLLFHNTTTNDYDRVIAPSPSSKR